MSTDFTQPCQYHGCDNRGFLSYCDGHLEQCRLAMTLTAPVNTAKIRSINRVPHGLNSCLVEGCETKPMTRMQPRCSGHYGDFVFETSHVKHSSSGDVRVRLRL
jgi:hypothetical protein